MRGPSALDIAKIGCGRSETSREEFDQLKRNLE
jgi:hypothetical protein